MNARVNDLIARATVVVLFSLLSINLLGEYMRTGHVTGLLLLVGESLVVVLTIVRRRAISASPLHGQVAAISVGIVAGSAVLDLDYAEDSQAETDMNVVMNNGGAYIEVQGSAEGHAFRRHELDALLNLASTGIAQLFALQAQSLDTAPP